MADSTETTEFIVCRKCGEMVPVAVLKAEYRRCPSCDEPDLRFFDVDSANWSSDYFPGKDEQG